MYESLGLCHRYSVVCPVTTRIKASSLTDAQLDRAASKVQRASASDLGCPQGLLLLLLGRQDGGGRVLKCGPPDGACVGIRKVGARAR